MAISEDTRKKWRNQVEERLEVDPDSSKLTLKNLEFLDNIDLNWLSKEKDLTWRQSKYLSDLYKKVILGEY